MKNLELLEDRLRSLGSELRESPSIAPEVMNRVHRLPRPAPPVRRPASPRWIVAALAAAMVAVTVWVSVERFSIHGRVLAALDDASSIYVRGERVNAEGQWEVGLEMWYVKGHGLREEYYAPMGETIIDDGAHRWQHLEGGSFAMRTPTSDPLGQIRELLQVDKLKKTWLRNPELDRLAEGKALQCFSDHAGVGRRESVWIDEGNRIRHFEERGKDEAGEYYVRERTEIDYGVPIELARFRPDFGDGVRIVDKSDGQALLEAMLLTHTPVPEAETMGIMLRVHRAVLVAGDYAFVLCSAQPSAEALAQAGFEAWPNTPGDLTMDVLQSRVGVDPEYSYGSGAIELANIRFGSVTAWWGLAPLPQSDSGAVSKFDILMSYNTHFNLAEKWQELGFETWQRGVAVGPVQLHGTAIPLEAALNQVYEEAFMIESGFGQGRFDRMVQVRTATQLIGYSKDPDGVERPGYIVSAWPSDITLEKFLKENRERIDSAEGETGAKLIGPRL